MANAYAMIMAGGAGTRLWPLSRTGRPKPLIPLVEQQRSMFQIAVERLRPLFPPERILVVANTGLTPQLRAQAPQLPAANFIVEPVGRDTAPAVGLGAIHIRRRDPQAVMAVLTADHHIADEQTFRRVLAAACAVAEGGAIVTLGIRPVFPATGFGYIERGALDRTLDGIEVFTLRQFREKPDLATAEQYLASGRFSWNSGMFIWRAQRVIDEFQRHAPDLSASLEQLAAAIGQPSYDDLLARIWPEIRRISVDYALMEHIREGIFVIPVEMGWSDIGDFGALYDVLAADQAQNISHGETAPVLIDTSGTLIYSERLVAAIGVENLVIVDTGDALLICRRDRAQDVRQIVERLKQEQRDTYL
jgi:mannose-1-phosphate guanylyltransferase